jgi:hypothetical protein
MSKYKNMCNYCRIFKCIKYFYVLTHFNLICTNMLSVFLTLFNVKARLLYRVLKITLIGIEPVIRHYVKIKFTLL